MSADTSASTRYKVRLTGELIEGVDRDLALKAFAQVFKVPREKADAAFASAPVSLKSGLDATQAKQYQRALTRIGMVSKVVAMDAQAGAVAAPAADSPPAASPEAAVPAPAPMNETPAAASPEVEEPESPRGLKYRIDGKPDYSFLTVQLPANATLKVEASAMATMDTTIRMKTRVKGGLGRFITGENIFINEFTAEAVPGEIGIAPGTPGDLTHRYLDGDTLYLQNSAYVASSPGVAVETKWQGLTKGFFSGESLFLIRCSGTGDLWFNTYGAIIAIDVTGDYVVDTGNIVAFTEGLEYKISKVGGYKSLFFSGEGFVCRFSGQGQVWIQTRSAGAFASWASFYRPAK